MFSEFYQVVTLHECMQDPAALAWLAQGDAPLPGEVPPGRYPAPSEIREALESIPGLRVEYRVSRSVWQASLTSRSDVSWAVLQVVDYCGDEDRPHRFCFTGGWDEVIQLAASRLAAVCGPLVLLHDSGAHPMVVF